MISEQSKGSENVSKYTTELRYICESLAGYDESQGYDDVDDIIRKSAPLVFSFSYPIFDLAYKLPLEMKILRHFYTREISEETFGLWKLRLQARLNEIMPYYNQLYRSETLEFNPLYDVDYTREYRKESNGEHQNNEVENTVNSETTENSLDQTNRGTGTITDAKTGTESRDNTGTITDAKSGYDTATGTGTITDNKTGTQTTTDDGTITDAKTGTETQAKTGKDTLNSIGTDTVTHAGTIGDSGSTSNTRTLNTSEATSVGKDTWDLYSDTPQGGINGLLDNGVVESGTDLANNTFLTNARHVMESGNSGTTQNTGTVSDSGSNSNTRTLDHSDQTVYNDQTVTNYDSELETTFNTENERTLDTEEQTTYNIQDQRTLNTQDRNAYNSQNQRTLNTSDDTTYNTQDQRTMNTTDTIEQTRDGQYDSEKERNLTDTGTVSNVDEYSERVFGKTGGYTYSKALMEYRKALLNIDKMVINELNDLFFGLW